MVAADDPNDMHGNLEDSRIRIVASNNSGEDWDDLLIDGKPKLIEDDAPAGSFQVFPTAAIDPDTGDLAVLWYDNRRGEMYLEDPTDPQSELLYYLDVFYSISTDQGANFSSPKQINDLRFNHSFGADDFPGATKRMGEYIGVALATDPVSATQHLYAVWTGNDNTGQQIFFGTDQCDSCPWDMDDDGSVGAFDLAQLLGAWGTNPCGPPDFNRDGDVDAFDLANLLGHWGPCP